MLSIRTQILEKLDNELSFINRNSGYSINVRNVYNGYVNQDLVKDYTSIAFVLGVDKLESEDVSGQLQYWSVDLIIFGHIAAGIDPEVTGKLSVVAEKFFDSIKKFIYRDKSVPKQLTSSIITLPEIESCTLTLRNPYTTGLGINKTMASMVFRIVYKEDIISDLQNSGSFGYTG